MLSTEWDIKREQSFPVTKLKKNKKQKKVSGAEKELRVERVEKKQKTYGNKSWHNLLLQQCHLVVQDKHDKLNKPFV